MKLEGQALVDHGNIGYIGLGNLGSVIASQIIEHGYKVYLWNRTIEKADPLLTENATKSQSLVSLGRECRIVFTCLNSAESLNDVLFGKSGLLNERSQVEYLIDNSTIAPQEAIRLSEKAKSFGMKFIDAPVSGGLKKARSKGLVCMVGDMIEESADYLPLIETFAENISFMGKVGNGQIAKACNQVMVFGNLVAMFEAMKLADEYGIDEKAFLSAIVGGFADSAIASDWLSSTQSDYSSPFGSLYSSEFSVFADHDRAKLVKLFSKDISISKKLAEDSGLDIALLNMISKLFKRQS